MSGTIDLDGQSPSSASGALHHKLEEMLRSIKVHNVVRMIEVPILVHNDTRYNGISVVLVEANDGTQSFFYKKGKQMVVPDYAEADWELFERLAKHVGWDDDGAFDKPQQ